MWAGFREGMTLIAYVEHKKMGENRASKGKGNERCAKRETGVEKKRWEKVGSHLSSERKETIREGIW